jgi:hypothetical protein
MTTPFGPQLIGETEKTLNALLLRSLDAAGVDGDITEPQWVTLRIASMLDGAVNDEGLAAAVADRAYFRDAADHVAALAARGLLDDGQLTADGRALLTRVQAALADDVSALFGDLEPDDVAATTRVLHDVLGRAHALLAR